MKKKHGDTTIAYFDTRILLAVILLAPLPIMPYQTRILRLSHPPCLYHEFAHKIPV